MTPFQAGVLALAVVQDIATNRQVSAQVVAGAFAVRPPRDLDAGIAARDYVLWQYGDRRKYREWMSS